MTQPNGVFEAKYISIKWADKKSALNIKESKDSLAISCMGNNHFELEATTFSEVSVRQSGQLAFMVKDEESNQSPFLLKSNGDKSYLIPVVDNLTKKKWWVEGEVWYKGDKKYNKEDKRWQSEIFRSAGNVNLRIGKYSCLIKIGANSFSYDELTKYLQDFKNDLWYLVLHETSYISAPVKQKKLKILDESSINFFNRFIEFANKIIDKPKSELREVQELRNIKQVKPTPRTFMEIASGGYKKQHTSRAYKPSYNVPENQYVFYLVKRVYILLNNLGKVSSFISSALEEKVEAQELRLKGFKDTIKISRQAVESDYRELRYQVVSEQNNLNHIVNNQNSTYINSNLDEICFTVTLGSEISFYEFYFAFYIKDQCGLNNLKNDDYYRLFFSNEFRGKLFSGNTYEIRAKIAYKIKQNSDQKNAHEINLKHICNITIINSLNEKKLKQIERQAIALKKSNWERPISKSEKKEQEQEILEIKALINSAAGRINKNNKLAEKLLPSLKKLKGIYRAFLKFNIQPSSVFPNSMSFIQNPNYQGVHKLYKEIQTLSGIDENLFTGLEDVEEIGILNTSLIYERWCFLQIIKVLIDKFRYLPEKDWKSKLLNQIINFDPNRVRNVQLKFRNDDAYRSLTLWYEKELPLYEKPSPLVNKNTDMPRRADFVIDMESYFNPENIKSKRLVLDAKFYENIDTEGGISKVINELYNFKSKIDCHTNDIDYLKKFKNYSDFFQNKVFILHPAPTAVPIVKTPQEWSEYTYLGETKMFDWDDQFPDHAYGGILLSPVENIGKVLDSLQMCIGMFLQYGIEENKLYEQPFNNWIMSQGNISKDSGFNPIPLEKIFCTVCGNVDHECEVKNTYYGLKWQFTCSDCHHKTFYNYCVNKSCRNRLIKNGPYWTYHATQSMQPYNIKCPSCGEIAVDMENE